MKPHSGRFRHSLGAATLSVGLIAGATVGVQVATAPSAIAHTGNLPVTATCNTVTGKYDFMGNLELSNVPSGRAGTSMWRIGTSSFDGTPTSNSGMDRGPINTIGDATEKLVGTEDGDVKFSLPGSTTGFGPWFYAYTKWPKPGGGNYDTKGSDGQLKIALKGDCTKSATQISAKALCGHQVDNTEWHFVATQVKDEASAPDSISVTWDNGQTAVVPLDKFTGKVAHYATTLNLDANVVSATADIYDGWGGQFNLSHGPACTVNPPGKDVGCTTAWLQPGRALVNGDHINIDVVAGGQKFQVNAYVDRNIAGGYDTLGLRLETPQGEKKIPLSEPEVKTGRLTFSFGQYLASYGYYEIEWVQFNSSYFNQDRDPEKFLKCGTSETIPVPATPSQNDPCGLNNATWNVPADTAKIDWTLRPDGHLVAETKNGFKFTDGKTSKDFGKAVDSNELCNVPIPAKPSYQDPCGPGNASWNVPNDTESLDWTLELDGDLVVVTKSDYAFEGGTTSKNFGKAPDSGVKCKVPVPPVPTQNDPCGLDNASWNKPADTVDYAWTLRPDGHLIVTVKGDNTFPDGSTSEDYGLPTDSNEPCKVSIPAVPSQNDPCGLNNATWNVPADTESLDWTLESNGDLVVATKLGYQFTDGTSSKNFGKAVDSGVKCTVPVPPVPTQNDPCGLGNASWNKPADSADYAWALRSDGHLVAAVVGDNTFPDGSTTKDYGLPTDSNEPCKVPVPAKPIPDDPCGINNATWVKPDDTASVAWLIEQNGDLIATTKSGYAFEDGTTSKNFDKAPDSGELCPPGVIPVPANQETVDSCNSVGVTNNVAWKAPLPADTDRINWSSSAGNTVRTATLKGDNVTWNDSTTAPKVFTLPADSGEKCATTPPVKTPPPPSDGSSFLPNTGGPSALLLGLAASLIVVGSIPLLMGLRRRRTS